MNHLARAGALAPLFLLVLGGCAANIGAPQNRDAFVEMVKPGGLFRSAEHVTVNRPYKAVVADVKEFSGKCLDVRVTRPPNYRYKEVGGSTTYHPKVETPRKGTTTLSVQEEYGNPRANSGAPPGGIFVLVAEIRADGGNRTQVDIYHLSRGEIAGQLKRWAEGGKGQCPSFRSAL